MTHNLPLVDPNEHQDEKSRALIEMIYSSQKQNLALDKF